jgi:hypothetical protein
VIFTEKEGLNMTDEIVRYGRGKHPNSRRALTPQWPQGQSGNPKGRPRKQPITEELERTGNSPCPESIRRTLAKLGMKLEENATWNQALSHALYHAAVSRGDVVVAREITDRLEGKIRPQLEEEDEPGNIKVFIQHIGGNGEVIDDSAARRRLPSQSHDSQPSCWSGG